MCTPKVQQTNFNKYKTKKIPKTYLFILNTNILFRDVLMHRNQQMQAAITVQSLTRCVQTRARFVRKIASIITLQKWDDASFWVTFFFFINF